MKSGQVLDKTQRDKEILSYCKRSLVTADSCRRSGAPAESLLILRSVFPVLVRAIYHRWKMPGAKGDASLPSMLGHLHSAGRIDNETFKRLREATVGLGEYATGSDVRFVIDACRLLLTLAQSDAFGVDEPANAPELVSEPHRPSRMRRWSTAATGLLTIGGAS